MPSPRDHADRGDQRQTVGTVVLAPCKTMATFTTTDGQPIFVSVGNVITLTAPATQDSGLSDLIGYVALQ